MTDDLSDAMQVRIFLDRPSYQCVGEYLDREGKSRSVIGAAVLLGNTWIVECSATQANELLGHAKHACPDAVARIVEGIRAAGLTPQDD